MNSKVIGLLLILLVELLFLIFSFRYLLQPTLNNQQFNQITEVMIQRWLRNQEPLEKVLASLDLTDVSRIRFFPRPEDGQVTTLYANQQQTSSQLVLQHRIEQDDRWLGSFEIRFLQSPIADHRLWQAQLPKQQIIIFICLQLLLLVALIVAIHFSTLRFAAINSTIK